MPNEDNQEAVSRENQQADKQIRELAKSISGHKSWLTRFEKDFKNAIETKSASSLDRVRDISARIRIQVTLIEDKYTTLIDLCQSRDVETEGHMADLDHATNTCQEVLRLVKEFEDEVAPKQAIPNPAAELPGNGEPTTNESHPDEESRVTVESREQVPRDQSQGIENPPPHLGGVRTLGRNAGASGGQWNAAQSGLFQSVPGTMGTQPITDRVQVECLKKLPTLTLRTFSGKPEENFQRWRHHFYQLIDTQMALTNSGKLTFLLQSLRGQALRQIEDFTGGNFSDGAYASSWTMLEKLYGGTVRENARTQVRFRQTTPLQSLRATELARVFIACSGLQTFHEEHGNQNCLRNQASADFRDARTKLGSYLRDYDLWTIRQQKQPCFNSLVDWLQEQHDASQLVCAIDGEDDYEDVSNHGRFDRQSQRGARKPPDNQRPEYSRQSGGTREFKCMVCGSSRKHKVEQCEKAKKMSPSDLVRLCQEKKACFHCLIPGHNITSCYIEKGRQCGVDGCSSYHHALLHTKPRIPRNNNNRNSQNRNRNFRDKRPAGASHANDEHADDEQEEESSKEEEEEESHKADEQNEAMRSSGKNGKISIQVATVRVHYKGRSVLANILLDEGSNNTNINEDLAEFLGMKSIEGPVDRVLNVMGGKKINVSSNLVQFEISPVKPPRCLSKYGVHDATRFPVEAWTMRDVCGRSTLVDWNVQKKNFSHLQDINIPTLTKKDKIDIVLGTNLPGLLAVLESRVGPSLKDPVAHLTRLGWFIMGPSEKNVGNYAEENSVAFRAQELDPEEDLDRLARAFWDSNEPQELPWQPPLPPSLGKPRDAVTLPPSLGKPRDAVLLPPSLGKPRDAVTAREGFSARDRKFPSEINQEAYDKMKISSNIEGKFYTAAIPWKNGRPKLTSNRFEVLKRQQSTFAPSYLSRKGVQLSELTKVIEDYKQKGYIRLLDPSEISHDSWYLPCFPVVDRSRATTKIRIVFDGQAEFRGTSLNKETLTGPNLLLNYLQILFRFRKFAVCFLGDISEMFLQIRLEDEDQKYHRFLFADENGDIKDYQWCRTVFGGTSIPNISQKVLHCLVEDFGAAYPEAIETIIRSLYMDDAVDSRRTIKEAVQTIKELSQLLPKAGMTPRKWMSNSCAVLDKVPHSERAKEVELVGNNMLLHDGKILGVKYSPQNDDFFLVGNEVPGGKGCRRKIPRSSTGEVIWTKRTVLSLLFKQYDPLGFVSPYTIRGKMIVQRLMALGLTWDVPIPKEYLKLWESWLSGLKDLDKVRIKRHIGMGPENAEHSIHCFVDASQEAYGTVFYLRTELKDDIQVAFLMSRARVTPMKAVSIARLELMAAQLGAETSLQVRGYLGESLPIYFYTDSMDVMFWLSQPSKYFKAFVANRCGVVQSLTNIKNWRHVPSASNAADVASRGSTVAELATNNLWWHGPPFLSGPISDFPKMFHLDDHTVDKKIRDELRPFLTFKSVDECAGLDNFLDPQKFSVGARWDGWKQLRRRAALFLGRPKLSRDERLQKAEIVLFRRAQYQSYGDVIDSLRDNKPISQKHPLAQYAVFLDSDGLLRSKSRLENTDIIPQSARLPIILPSRNRLTLLLAMSCHLTIGHAVGKNHLRSHLAKRFLIPSMYYVERQIIKQCCTCIRRNAQMAQQQMGPLPGYRFREPIQVFARTGIDFAGPFRIKQKRETRSNPERPKHYVLVFTCLSVRAVHFEVTPSIDTDAVLNAISRFSDRRGVPEVIVSDNGKSFESADRILQELYEKIDKDKLKEATSYGYKEGQGIKWEFNPPYASHMGGVYEIIVKAMKRALHSTYGYADLYLDEFLTAITGAEGLLNSRPLGMVKMDPQESVVITPNHFLHGTVGDLYQPSTLTDQSLGRKWRYLMELQKHYKTRFVNEILPQLHPRRKWKSQSDGLRVDDLVLELSDSEPRSLWKLARVVEVLPGSDDLIRKVKIRILGGDTDFLRPIHRLLPLEFGSESAENKM